ncbi:MULTISPECIES: response regulator [Paenibacillus]|uniref:Response regulator n=1 Tax=Paenibacillus violae TaxID=3077234 RepID=A0ABU3RI35_9BACL|nr:MULTISPECIES: response regulator [Paenibacillus]MDU0203731.1 response regulator [Paenibacillus sp. PFR10]MEC0264353.1 response regulator [Paenibacillus anseongense]
MMTVVVVEDEPIVRMGLIALMESEAEGFKVVGEAEDGQQALALARLHVPDIIITDIRMPVMDGVALMLALKQEGISSSVIVVSGYGEFEYAQQALRAGAADYLLKPINEDHLLPTLHALREKIRLEKARIVHDNKEQLWSFKTSAKQLARDLWDLRELEIEKELNSLQHELTNNQMTTHDMERKLTGYIALLEDEFRSVSGQELPFPRGLDKITHHFDTFIAHIYAAMKTIRGTRNWGYGKVIQAGIAYVEKYYGDPDLTLTKIAQQLEVKPANFSHMFKTELGVPFSQYLIRLRMDQAAKQLSDSANKVYEVSAAVGFSDYVHFSKMFKRHMGFTPTEYRQSKWKL